MSLNLNDPNADILLGDDPNADTVTVDDPNAAIVMFNDPFVAAKYGTLAEMEFSLYGNNEVVLGCVGACVIMLCLCVLLCVCVFLCV